MTACLQAAGGAPCQLWFGACMRTLPPTDVSSYCTYSIYLLQPSPQLVTEAVHVMLSTWQHMQEGPSTCAGTLHHPSTCVPHCGLWHYGASRATTGRCSLSCKYVTAPNTAQVGVPWQLFVQGSAVKCALLLANARASLTTDPHAASCWCVRKQCSSMHACMCAWSPLPTWHPARNQYMCSCHQWYRQATNRCHWCGGVGVWIGDGISLCEHHLRGGGSQRNQMARGVGGSARHIKCWHALLVCPQRPHR
jgi:hypothetical protein